MPDFLKPVMVPIHREGYPFIVLFAIPTIVLGLFFPVFWVIGGILTAWCVYFFRDPTRVTPERQNLVISPADGIVSQVAKERPPEELDMDDHPVWRVSVFMNVFDVHINRAPVDGEITAMHYRPGAFINASLDKASKDNERQSFRITSSSGKDIAMVQIAGLIARRILSDVEPGDSILAGQRVGMIRFGSRVDVYLPRNINPIVSEGQRMIAGETVMADLGGVKGKEPPRKGVVR